MRIFLHPIIIIALLAPQGFGSIGDRKCVVSTISWNNVGYANVLFNSVSKNVVEDVSFFLLVVDHFEPMNLHFSFSDRITLVNIHDLKIPYVLGRALQYDVTEMNCFVRPFFFEWLLFTTRKCTSVLYFDTDTRVYGSIEFIFKILEKFSFVVTPHSVQPLPDDGLELNDRHILSAGVFNLGFFGVSRTENGKKWLSYWKHNLERYGFSDIWRWVSSLFFHAPC
jgi:hypothetical protein